MMPLLNTIIVSHNFVPIMSHNLAVPVSRSFRDSLFGNNLGTIKIFLIRVKIYLDVIFAFEVVE